MLRFVFIFLFMILSGALYAIGYDSTFVLSIKQKFAIPEQVINGDEVGIWKKTYTWRSYNKVKFSILSNFNSAFAIDENTGNITIINARGINGKIKQQDTIVNIIIRTTDSSLGFEDDTCEIHVKENSYCKFIDYSYLSNGNGKRDNPYNDLANNEIKAGYGYFIKRGNIVFKRYYDFSGFRATFKHPVIIAAYSSGNNPVFDGKDLGTGYEAFDFKNIPFPSQHCKIYNIDIINYPSMAIRIATRSSNFGIYNCNFSNNIRTDFNKDLGDIYFFGTAEDTLKKWDHELINLESAGSFGPIVKTDASGIKALNIKAATANKQGRGGYNFRFAISYFSSLKHFWFIGGGRSVQVRFPYVEISDGIITYANYCGILLTTNETYKGVPNNIVISNVLFRNNGYGIYVFNSNINNSLIESCRFERNYYDGIYFRSYGNKREIRYCSFINNNNHGIEIASKSKVCRDIAISFNLFYGNKNKAINTANSQNIYALSVVNNTINGVVDFSGAVDASFSNNFYKTFIGNASFSNNLALDSISTEQYFKDYKNHNYHLKETAIKAKGQPRSLKSTIEHVTNYIGAFKYEN